MTQTQIKNARTDILTDRLTRFRGWLSQNNLDGFLLPRTDEYQSEYLAPYAERLSWLTGFTGSNAFAIILKDKAYVSTDGRYTLQIKKEVPPEHFALGDMMVDPVSNWLAKEAHKGARIGYDAKLLTPKQFEKFESVAKKEGMTLIPVAEHPIDAIRTDKLDAPESAVTAFNAEFAGRDVTEKRALIAQKLKEAGVDGFVLTQPDTIAWLLNVRSDDIPHTPVPLSYALITNEGAVHWYIKPDRVSDTVRATFGNHVSLTPPEQMADDLMAFCDDAGKRVGLDPARTPLWFYNLVKETKAQVKDMDNPCILPRACKTTAEQKAMKKAHERDGKAVHNFLSWIKSEAAKPDFTFSELDVVAKLRAFREETGKLKDDSFETIAGWNENGAVIHYRAEESTNLPIQPPGILLLDSGAQYEDGTTDITRTIALGTPTAEQVRNATLVLKAHIALARAKFPEGTTGAQLDAICREVLWQERLDYAHGTGHGVGCYLSVHEEATAISPRVNDAVKAGMILSNEPGYYKDGEYGIRHENLVLVVETGAKTSIGRPLLAFETITLVPFDDDLIDETLLTAEELAWLSAYQEKSRANCAQ